MAFRFRNEEVGIEIYDWSPLLSRDVLCVLDRLYPVRNLLVIDVERDNHVLTAPRARLTRFVPHADTERVDLAARKFWVSLVENLTLVIWNRAT